MKMQALSVGAGLVLLSLLAGGCRDAPAPTQTGLPALPALKASMQADGPHGTSILQPASNVTVIVDPSLISTYAIPIEAEFHLQLTYGFFSGFKEWRRDIRWRSCGTNAQPTSLYSAHTPIFPNQTYNLEYTQQTSLAPGAYGQYEIISRSYIYSCPGEFCFDGDSVRATRCVTLAEPPPPLGLQLDGPSVIQSHGTYTYTATTTNFTNPSFTWRERFCDDTQGVSCTTWQTLTGLGNTFTPTLGPDCGTPERNFQVEVTALNWDGQSLTRGKLTYLCLQ